MVIEENDRIGSLLKYEADKNYSREVVTIAQGQNLKMGAVLGKVTENDTYKAVSIEDEESDGSDSAVGVLFADVDATAAATEAVIISRDAIVIGSALVYPTGTTDEQKKAFLKDLEGRGIVARSAA